MLRAARQRARGGRAERDFRHRKPAGDQSIGQRNGVFYIIQRNNRDNAVLCQLIKNAHKSLIPSMHVQFLPTTIRLIAGRVNGRWTAGVVLVPPIRLQSGDGAGRQAGGIRPQERSHSLRKNLSVEILLR